VKLIVGLGNPGQAYRWTRHNLGFLLIDELAVRNGIEIARRGLQSEYGRGKIRGEEVLLAKPQTFMNRSGEAAARLLRFFKVPPEDLIIIHDDLDLPCGKIRIRLQGGHGGHQGVKSVIESVGGDGFLRVKIGIGRPSDPRRDPADYVLEPVRGDLREEFEAILRRVTDALETVLLAGPQEAMDRFHGNPKQKAENLDN
jgi:PTH1 family peptidyl-tRNA hydrolase